MDQLYLDNNATTRIDPRVVEAMQAGYEAGLANPASQHQAGQRARQVLERAREDIARFVGAETSGMRADQVIFTSGGTEANNLALLGLTARSPGRVLISAIEHPCVAGAADELARRGYDVRRLRVDESGVVDPCHVQELLTPDTRLISLMLANHETGVQQPIMEVARLCTERGVPLHTDAVQAVGKVPVHFRELGVSALSLSAHKFHGPVGIGVLVVRHGTPLSPILFGGFQQGSLRPGTESVVLAMGLRRALEICHMEANERREQMVLVRDQFEAKILRELPAAVINGGQAQRLPHTSNISFVGWERQTLFMALDLAGLACSTGSACASGSSEVSPVLIAMGLDESRLGSALRFSFSALSTVADAREAARRIVQVCKDLQRQNPGQGPASTPRQWNSKSL